MNAPALPRRGPAASRSHRRRKCMSRLYFRCTQLAVGGQLFLPLSTHTRSRLSASSRRVTDVVELSSNIIRTLPLCAGPQAREPYSTIAQRTPYVITAEVHSIVTSRARLWKHEITCSADPSGWPANHGPDVEPGIQTDPARGCRRLDGCGDRVRSRRRRAAASPKVVGQKYSDARAHFPVPDTRSWCRTPSAIRSRGPTASSPTSRTGRCRRRRTQGHPQPTRRFCH